MIVFTGYSELFGIAESINEIQQKNATEMKFSNYDAKALRAIRKICKQLRLEEWIQIPWQVNEVRVLKN